MWEAMGVEKVVARYVDLQEKVADPEFSESGSAAFWAQLVALEDRLGLSPMAMMKLQWEIEGATTYEDPLEDRGGTVTRIDGVRERLRGGQA